MFRAVRIALASPKSGKVAVTNMRLNILHWLARSRSVSRLVSYNLLGSLLLLLSAVMLSAPAGFAHSETMDDGGPVLLSVFPVGAKRGSTVQAEIRGHRLAGASGVWLNKPGLKARLLKVEEVKDDYKQKVNPLEKQKKPMTMYRAVVELRIDPKAPLGDYPLRIVSPHGISNPVGFPLVDERVILETPGSHQDIAHAQPAMVPAII